MFEANILRTLAENHYHTECLHFQKIPQSGSHRLYFRMIFDGKPSLMGVYNDDVKENEAFFSFTEFFTSQGIRVPQIFAIDNSRRYYLLSDLGDETLYAHLCAHREGERIGQETLTYYQKVLKELPRLQLCGRKGLDFSKCYPCEVFDRQAMQWDLNYFKYCFLKIAHVEFDEQALENDFQKLLDFLMQADTHYFLFRDFQSRNIMLHDGEVFFIDYQGGRKGALPYDVASLLYDGKADLSPALREELLQFYLDELEKHIAVDRKEFEALYEGFVFIRILQAFGTYGYRGLTEKKVHFIKSIPYATRNLLYLMEHTHLPMELPELFAVIRRIATTEWAQYDETAEEKDKLTVEICSFSYKNGIPTDYSGNGGGFVFDCRALPNPGRLEKFKCHTGRDPMVAEYLEQYEKVTEFKDATYHLVKISVDNYLERQFTHLSVGFGCTGGQHRSVYFAEALARKLSTDYGQRIAIKLKHTNVTNWRKE